MRIGVEAALVRVVICIAYQLRNVLVVEVDPNVSLRLPYRGGSWEIPRLMVFVKSEWNSDGCADGPVFHLVPLGGWRVRASRQLCYQQMYNRTTHTSLSTPKENQVIKL